MSANGDAEIARLIAEKAEEKKYLLSMLNAGLAVLNHVLEVEIFDRGRVRGVRDVFNEAILEEQL